MSKDRYQIHVVLQLDVPKHKAIYDEIKRRQESGETMADIVRNALSHSFENGDNEVLSVLERIEAKLDRGITTHTKSESEEDRELKRNLLNSLEKII